MKRLFRKEDLLRLYVAERKTQKEVAHVLHTSHRIVRRSLIKYGIPIRNCQERHGMSGTLLYRAWVSMKCRCDNPNTKVYPMYGGRGIGYVWEWASFTGFQEDMGSEFAEGLTLDRIDPDKSYSRDNCRWVPPSEQARNRRNNVRLTLNGQTKCASEWVRELGLVAPTLYNRIQDGWTDEEALTALTQSPEIRERDANGRFLSVR